MFKSLINTVLSILLIIISTFLFSYKVKAQTGSCAANYPTIGLIEKIVENENYLDVSLSNAFQPDVSYFENKNIYEIDGYENIVKNYVQNNFSLTEPYLENSQEIKLGNQVFLPLEILKLTSLKKGDMIINGPPSNGCSYAFTGVFTPDGNLKYAVIEDNYQQYSYRNSILSMKEGQELQCTEDLSSKDILECIIEVEYTFGNTTFKLSPGQSYKIQKGNVDSIYLLDSKKLKLQPELKNITISGLPSSSLVYIINFQDLNKKITTLPSPSNSSSPSNKAIKSSMPPLQIQTSTDDLQDLNFLQKVFLWFLSFFQRN